MSSILSGNLFHLETHALAWLEQNASYFAGNVLVHSYSSIISKETTLYLEPFASGPKSLMQQKHDSSRRLVDTLTASRKLAPLALVGLEPRLCLCMARGV
jgi:hypothetical protein